MFLDEEPFVIKSRRRQLDHYFYKAEIKFEDIKPEKFKKSSNFDEDYNKKILTDKLPNRMRDTQFPIVSLPHLEFIESNYDSCEYLYKNQRGEYVNIDDVYFEIKRSGGIFEIIDYKIRGDHRRLLGVYICIRADTDIYEQLSCNPKWTITDIEVANATHSEKDSIRNQLRLFE